MSMERTNLVKAREEKNWSQDDLAEIMEVSRHIISDWERGLKRPYPRNRRKLGQIFGVENTNELLKIMSVPEGQKPSTASDKDEGDPSLQDERTTGSAEAPPDIDESITPTAEAPRQAVSSEDSTTKEAAHASMVSTAESSMQSDQDHTTPSLPIVLRVPGAVQKFIASSLERRLWHIAHTNYSDFSEMTSAIQQAIEESDMINMGNTTYEINRREAICSLAALPMTILGQKPTLQTKHYDEMLMHCTAALEACWQLYRGSDPMGTQHAFECTCTYVPLLEAIAHTSNTHQKEALDLATRYALLQTLLGWNYRETVETVSYAQNAMKLSRETSNILLQISATTKLSWSYLQSRNHIRAWETMQEGEHLLKIYQRDKKKALLPSGIIGNFYSSHSLAQVSNGISPDRALGIATDSDPLSGHIAFIEFTESSQWLEAARICSAKGDPKQAMIWVGKRIDLETLTPRVRQSERGRIQATNILTRSLLQLKGDMGKIIETWMVGIEGAKTLKSEEIYRKAIANFELMQALYPGERAIMRLIPLTAHW